MRTTTTAVLLAVGLAALVGCGSGDDNADIDASNTTPSTVASAPVTVSALPSPDAAQTQTLTAALRAIKPALAEDEERAVRRSRSVCQDIQQGKDAATLASNANYRFSGGTAGQLTDDQGAKIVDAVTAAFCK